MDKIAIISDIHGNLPALETVLADIQARGIEEIYCLGDLAGKGPYSAEAVDVARAQCAVIVQGNWDLMMSQPHEHPAVIFWQEQLGQARLDYLGNLPYCYDLQLSGQVVRLYHASQESVYFRVFPWDDKETLAAMFANSEATGLDRPVPQTVLYGDIHAAYLLPINRSNQLINVGSVGNPLDQTWATYVILNGEREASQRSNIDVEFVRLPYDVEATIAHARAINMPETEALAQELRTGIYRGASS
ncbi:MAG: metallophosphoesterase family protein [Ardenticatenales bacterium]|nr:metallophosphoesterase family protein [Ardenticatenales bacterium]